MCLACRLTYGYLCSKSRRTLLRNFDFLGRYLLSSCSWGGRGRAVETRNRMWLFHFLVRLSAVDSVKQAILIAFSLRRLWLIEIWYGVSLSVCMYVINSSLFSLRKILSTSFRLSRLGSRPLQGWILYLSIPLYFCEIALSLLMGHWGLGGTIIIKSCMLEYNSKWSCCIIYFPRVNLSLPSYQSLNLS